MSKRVGLWLIFAAVFCFAAQLSGEDAKPDCYQVTVLGDVHFDGAEFHTGDPVSAARARERKRNLKMWAGKSKQLLETAAKQTAKTSAFAVQLGDISQGDCETQELHAAMLRAAFSAVKTPFADTPLLVVKGNHDVRGAKKQNDPVPAAQALLPAVAKELGVTGLADGNYTYRKGKDLFIAVDGFVPAKKIAAFVRKALADHADARYVILMTHLPVLPVSAGNPFWLLPGWQEIAAMLETRRAVVLAAHTHVFSVTERKSGKGRLVQLVTTSMGSAWTPGHALQVAYTREQWRTAAGKKGEKDPKLAAKLAALDKSGAFSGTVYKGKSGFTVLDIDDRRIEARVFTDASGEPALTVTLVENK